MTQRWMLTTRRDFDEGDGQTCPDRIDRPAPFVLRCEGGGEYSADEISTPCACGQPCRAIVRGIPAETF